MKAVFAAIAVASTPSLASWARGSTGHGQLSTDINRSDNPDGKPRAARPAPRP